MAVSAVERGKGCNIPVDWVTVLKHAVIANPLQLQQFHAFNIPVSEAKDGEGASRRQTTS
jgi:hypothetical protein